jgi:hypothetical protein
MLFGMYPYRGVALKEGMFSHIRLFIARLGPNTLFVLFNIISQKPYKDRGREGVRESQSRCSYKHYCHEMSVWGPT